jgi:hypothetical protein
LIGDAGFVYNGKTTKVFTTNSEVRKPMLKYIPLACALALSSLALPAQTTAVASTVETTAMIGLAQGQTAQLNLLNAGVQPPATGVICTAAVSYFDSAGTLLKASTLSIAPGKSGSTDLSGDTDLSIAAGARREIRAQISVPAVPPPTSTGAAPTVAPVCKLIPTLEIFDSVTGRTLVTLGRVQAIEAVVATPVTPAN